MNPDREGRGRAADAGPVPRGRARLSGRVDASVEPRDLGCRFELLAEAVVLQGEPLDVRDGQVEVLGELVVISPQLLVVALELVEPADHWLGGGLAGGRLPKLELDRGLGEVAAERGVGQQARCSIGGGRRRIICSSVRPLQIGRAFAQPEEQLTMPENMLSRIG